MRASLIAILLAVGGVAADRQTTTNPYASTYQPAPSQTTVIRNATILTAAGPQIDARLGAAAERQGGGGGTGGRTRLPTRW